MQLRQLILSLLVLLAACKKTDDQPPQQQSTGTTVFQLAKSSVQPLEVLLFTISTPVARKPTEATLGTLQMPVQVVNDSTFAVQIPEGAQDGTFPFAIADGKNTVQISVAPMKPVTDPLAYTQAYLQQVNTSIARLKVWQDTLIARKQLTAQAAAATRTTLQQKATEASQAFVALSTTDRRLCAQTLAANRATIDSLSALLADIRPGASPSGRLSSPCSTNPEEAVNCTVQKAERITEMLFVTGLTLVASISSFAAGNLAIGSVVGLLSGAYLLSLLKEIEPLTAQITVESILPMENNAQVNISTGAPNQFRNETARTVKFQLTLRNVQDYLDLNSSNPVVQSFAKSYNKIKLLFKGKLGDLTNTRFDWSAEKQTTVLPRLASKLKVTLSAGSKVSVKVIDFVKGTFNVIFTTTEKTDQKFDYTITYDYGGQTISKTITDNTLLVSNSGIDLSDCQIKSLTGLPITAAGTVDTEYTFLLDGTCKFSDKARFVWNFGDGVEISNIATSQVKHTYKKSGKYTIQLRVFPLATSSEYLVFDKEIRVDDLTGINKVYFLVNGVKVDYPVDEFSLAISDASIYSIRATSTANADYKYYLQFDSIVRHINKTGDYLIERNDPTYYPTYYIASLSIISRDASNKLVTKRYASIAGKLSVKAFAYTVSNTKITATFEFTAREVSDGSIITVTGGYLTNY